ncbi:MAG: hypothetical protein R2710_16395 [Acidimicrobiales bacterium]
MSEKKRESILNLAFEPTTVTTGVHLVATQGTGSIEQAGGLVIVDAGPGGGPTDQMITEWSISDRREASRSCTRTGMWATTPASLNGGPTPPSGVRPNRSGSVTPMSSSPMRYTAMFDNQVMLNQGSSPRSRSSVAWRSSIRRSRSTIGSCSTMPTSSHRDLLGTIGNR